MPVVGVGIRSGASLEFPYLNQTMVPAPGVFLTRQGLMVETSGFQGLPNYRHHFPKNGICLLRRRTQCVAHERKVRRWSKRR